MAILGSMGLSREHLPIDLMPRLWSMVVRRLLDTEKEVLHEVRMLSTLLLHGTYEAVTAGPSAEPMRAAVEEALRLTFDITDEWHRRRRARAWVPAGRAALGSGDRPLARAIAGAIAPTSGWTRRVRARDPGGSRPENTTTSWERSFPPRSRCRDLRSRTYTPNPRLSPRSRSCSTSRNADELRASGRHRSLRHCPGIRTGSTTTRTSWRSRSEQRVREAGWSTHAGRVPARSGTRVARCC
jgi:hypothetical protein